METKVHDFPVTQITKEELANYISKAFTSSKYKEILKQSKNMGEAFQSYEALGFYLTTYGVASADVSSDSIDFVLDHFLKHRAEIKRQKGYYSLDNATKKAFFEKELLPDLTSKWIAKLSLEKPIQLKDIVQIQKAIYMQCKNNSFYTHSFNGALVEKVQKQGLDIHSELFQEEYKALFKLSGDTSFKKGYLCYCELSETSFGYAIHSPERLHMVLEDIHIKQKNDETLQEYYERCLKYQIENKDKGFTEEEKKEIIQSIQKIISFYFGQSQSAIAIMEKDSNTEKPPSMINPLYSDFLELKQKLRRVIKNDEEVNDLYEKVKQLFIKEDEQALFALQQFMECLDQKYPDKGYMQEFINHTFSNTLMSYCFNNYLYAGFGDGYTAPNGVIEKEEFAIAQFENPCDLYAKHRKNLLSQIESKLSVQISPYKMMVSPDQFGGVPYPTLKTDVELEEENKMYVERLESLYNEEKISMEILKQMIETLTEQYRVFKEKAPVMDAWEDLYTYAVEHQSAFYVDSPEEEIEKSVHRK